MASLRDEREAARAGTISVGCRPVLAEDLPAGPASPRDVCLEEVRGSDGLLLILGSSYGDAPPPSMTEEEYLAAREADVPVFCLATNEQPVDEEQRRFRQVVLDAVAGQFVVFFDGPDEVAEAARRALEYFFHPSQPEAVARIADTLLTVLEQARELFNRVMGEGRVGPYVGTEAAVLAQEMDDRRDAIGDESLRRAVIQTISACRQLWQNQPGYGREDAVGRTYAAQALRASEAATRGARAASRAIRRCHFFRNSFPNEHGPFIGRGIHCGHCGEVIRFSTSAPACPYCGQPQDMEW